MIAVAWSLACLFSVPMLINNVVKQVLGMKQCWTEMSEWAWKVSVHLVYGPRFFEDSGKTISEAPFVFYVSISQLLFVYDIITFRLHALMGLHLEGIP